MGKTLNCYNPNVLTFLCSLSIKMGFSSFDFTLHIKLKTCNRHFIKDFYCSPKKLGKCLMDGASWQKQLICGLCNQKLIFSKMENKDKSWATIAT
jgi:hypothetical protein